MEKVFENLSKSDHIGHPTPTRITMNRMIRNAAVLLVTLLYVLAPFPTQAEKTSSSGDTMLDITLPDYIILHHYGNVTLNMSLSSQSVSEGENTLDVDWSGLTSEGNQLSSSNIQTVTGNFVETTLANVWGVRGFSKDGTAQVSISIVNNRLESGDDSKITITRATLDDNNGNTGETITTNLNGIAKSRATFGNVILKLNFTYARKSGNYSGGQYKITASII